MMPLFIATITLITKRMIEVPPVLHVPGQALGYLVVFIARQVAKTQFIMERLAQFFQS
jgi:hypothetical protein